MAAVDDVEQLLSAIGSMSPVIGEVAFDSDAAHDRPGRIEWPAADPPTGFLPPDPVSITTDTDKRSAPATPRSVPMLWSAAQFILDHVPVGIALVDASLQAIMTNKALRQRLQTQDGVEIRDGAFLLTDRHAHKRLLSRLALPLENSNSQRREAFGIRAARAGQKPDLHVLLTAARTSLWCLWIFDPAGPRQLSADLLRDLHGLTQAEARVAAALFAGRSTKEVANELDVSVNTVKAHLKGIFRKCEVRSQAELSQLLALGSWDFR